MSFCKFGATESEKIYLKLGAYSRGLPVEYSQFLERTNGGIFVEKNPIYIEDCGKEIQIDVLYGIHENQRIDLHFWNEIQNYKNALHRFSIVIGDTTNHGFIVYQFRNADPGIYFWDICGALESSAEGANAYRIADNFSDFLVMLGIKNEKNNRFKIPKNPYNLEEINDEILALSEDGQTTQKINIAEYRKSIQCFSDFSLLHRYTKAYKIEMLTNEGLNKIESAKGYKFSDSFRKFVITQNSHDSYYMVNHQADDGSPFILLGFYEGAFESAIERNLYCNDVKNAIESGEIEKAESLMQLYKRFIIFAENENEDFAIDTVSGCIVHINHNTFTVRKIADNFDEFIEQPYVPQAEAEKTKEFELLYKEKQSNMVTACLEYVLGRADKIFIYCSAEGRIISSSYFYEIDGKAVDRHELKSISPSYDTSSSRQQECLGILNENIKAMKYLCEKYDRIMPTEIKMIYDVKTHSIEWEDNYKLVHSNHKTKGPNDFANEWFKEVKSELERIAFEEKKRLEVNSVLSKDIIDALNKQKNVSFEAPATPQEINDAQKRLNLKFSDDYIQFLLKYGSVSSDDIELVGISVDEYSDVVYLTETIKGYEYNEYIPSNWYVIEDVGIDGLVAWQDEKGRVYLTLPCQAPQKYADSLVEYIIKATTEEEDETTENTETDSANEVCEFENNDFEKTGSLTDEEVRKLEEKMGKNFPADYKLFLLKTNGGRCNHEHEHGINVADIKEEPIYIDTFFGIDEIKACDLFYWNSMYGEDIPEEAIIIGDALSNGFIIYNYSVEDKGIYYWDSSYTFECSSDEWNTYFMAKDFNELLKLANIKIDDDKDFVVKDAVEQAGDLFGLIDGLENLFYKNAATLEEIEEAEKRLGVKFAEDYKKMMLKYGSVSSTPIGLAGISKNRYSNVVYLTETTKEYEYNEYIPSNWYVIEDVGVDELIAWQDEKGRVYLTLPGQAPQKYADSLVEYIIKATAEEEDETTENAQTDSANEVCEFENNSSQKDFVAKDADKQTSDLFGLIDGLENLFYKNAATLEEIEEAEKRLGVKFAEDYVQMLLKYGFVSSTPLELAGISVDRYLNVVYLTETTKGYEYNEYIPSNWYVIEDVGVDELIAWQDEKGRVYLTLPGQAPQKYADSLVEYIIKATAEEEDETTENAQTDSANEVCEFKNNSSQKDFIVKDADEQAVDILSLIDGLENLYCEEPATLEEIAEAEKRLGVKFAEEYVQMLLKYGTISSDDIELVGLSADKCYDVVHLTETIKGYEYNKHIPSSWYIIENVGIDGLVAWQDEKGRVYLTLPGQAPQKYADSLVEYIIKATAEEEDETTENTQTDSDNFAICDKDKTSDGKVFEDLFMEMQSDMVVACLKYVNGDADKIYIYGSAEGRVITSDYFYEIDGMVVERHKLNTISPSYDVSSSRQKACLEILNEDLKDLKDLCKEHDRPMPTEMKMVYNVKTGSFETAYKYEPVYSNHETKTANDIVDKWYEQVKKETEKK